MIIKIKHLIRSQVAFLWLRGAEINLSTVAVAQRRANSGLFQKRLERFSNLAALTSLFKVNTAMDWHIKKKSVSGKKHFPTILSSYWWWNMALRDWGRWVTAEISLCPSICLSNVILEMSDNDASVSYIKITLIGPVGELQSKVNIF